MSASRKMLHSQVQSETGEATTGPVSAYILPRMVALILIGQPRPLHPEQKSTPKQQFLHSPHTSPIAGRHTAAWWVRGCCIYFHGGLHDWQLLASIGGLGNAMHTRTNPLLSYSSSWVFRENHYFKRTQNALGFSSLGNVWHGSQELQCLRYFVSTVFVLPGTLAPSHNMHPQEIACRNPKRFTLIWQTREIEWAHNPAKVKRFNPTFGIYRRAKYILTSLLLKSRILDFGSVMPKEIHFVVS